MPIIRARYPDDWEAIAVRVKHEADWCCEQCKRPCRRPSESLAVFLKRVKGWRHVHTLPPPDFAEAPRRYLLTVAHLDQRPEHCDRTNLKALCTVCHLRFDRRFRATQKRLKAEFRSEEHTSELQSQSTISYAVFCLKKKKEKKKQKTKKKKQTQH